jgi:DNA-binding beta-propeller fold protein YncE
MSVTQPVGAISTIAVGSFADATFSSDGSKLYTVSGNTVSVINLATGTNAAQYTFGNQLGALDVSLDGKYLAVVDEQPGNNGNLYRIDLTSGVVTGYTLAGAAALSDVVFLADGSVAVSQQAWGPLDVVNLQTGDSFVALYMEANATISVSADATCVVAQLDRLFGPFILTIRVRAALTKSWSIRILSPVHPFRRSPARS